MIPSILYKSESVNQHMLKLPTCKGLEFIDTSTIVRVEAMSNYSKLFFNNGKTLVVAKVLHWFEESLSAILFIRTHRTHLINKNFIRQYINADGGKLVLCNGECIDVSKRKKNNLLRHLCAA